MKRKKWNGIFFMCGQCGLRLDDMWKMTLREFIMYCDGVMMSKWDHTATLSYHMYVLTKMVHDMFSKKKLPNYTISNFHPLMEKKKKGLRIDRDNIGKLKAIFNL